jgi:uncharacterized protein YcfJ
MNAKTPMTTVSTLVFAVTALAAAVPAYAGDHRDFRRGERAAVTRHLPPQHVVVQRSVYQSRPQVVVRRPVVVHRPVVVERRVVVHRPVPAYHQRPVRTAYHHAPAPVYYDQRAAHYDNDSNPAGAVAGAVIGGVIGSQVGDYESRGMTTVIGAILGGLIGNGL